MAGDSGEREREGGEMERGKGRGRGVLPRVSEVPLRLADLPQAERYIVNVCVY